MNWWAFSQFIFLFVAVLAYILFVVVSGTFALVDRYIGSDKIWIPLVYIVASLLLPAATLVGIITPE